MTQLRSGGTSSGSFSRKAYSFSPQDRNSATATSRAHSPVPAAGLLRDGEAGVLTYPYQQEQRDGGEDAEKGGQSDPGSAPLPSVQIFLRQLPAYSPQRTGIGCRLVGGDGLRRRGEAAGLSRALQLILQ